MAPSNYHQPVRSLRPGIHHATSVLCLFTISLVGCGDPQQPTRVEVSGRVLLDGIPLQHGAIMFIPINDTPGPKTGAAIVDGNFSLPADAGPEVGNFQIQITNDRPPYDLNTELQTQTIPSDQPTITEAYNTHSELHVETTTSGPNHFEFDLSSNSTNN